MNPTMHKIGYAAFVLLAAYQAFNRDFALAASSAGIALIFDPIGSDVPWKDRSTLQRGWLLLHLALTAALMGAYLFSRSS